MTDERDPGPTPRLRRRPGGQPVGVTVMAAFALLAALVGAEAWLSVRALGEAEAIVERTFDRSMTALNALRSAESAAAAIPASHPAEQAVLLENLINDLEVIAERAPGPAGVEAARLAAGFRDWTPSRLPSGSQADLADAFLVLSEHLAADAYVERESAIATVAGILSGQTSDEVGLVWLAQARDVAGIVGGTLLWIAAALTLITGFDYFRKALPYLKDPA